jgi:hypothetical protein
MVIKTLVQYVTSDQPVDLVYDRAQKLYVLVSTNTVFWLMVLWLMPHAVASGCRRAYDMEFANLFWNVCIHVSRSLIGLNWKRDGCAMFCIMNRIMPKSEAQEGLPRIAHEPEHREPKHDPTRLVAKTMYQISCQTYNKRGK